MPTEHELFRRYFTGRSSALRPAEFIRKIMILGYVSYHKWDEATAWQEQNGGKDYPNDRLLTYSITETRVDEMDDRIIKALGDYLESVRPHGFWYGVGQNIVGAFLYSLLLLAAVLIVLFSDVNIPEMLGISITAHPPS